MRKVVLIEINEVPHVIMEAYAKRSPFWARFMENSARFETLAADKIQLDPWIAWPSFHRGVNDEAHRLLRLGQRTEAADTAYPPVWRMLMRRMSVSVSMARCSRAAKAISTATPSSCRTFSRRMTASIRRICKDFRTSTWP